MSLPSPSPTRSVRGTRLPRGTALRIGLWSALAALIFGAIELGLPIEDGLRQLRDKVREHRASEDIVVVGIDDRSLEAFGVLPWPRRRHAQLIEALQRQGARRIFFDVEFNQPSRKEEDRILQAAFARSRPRVTVGVYPSTDKPSGPNPGSLLLPTFAPYVDAAAINVRYDYMGLVRRLPFAIRVGDRTYPSVAASFAGRSGEVGDLFPIDYAINPRTVPTISAIDVIGLTHATGDLTGKDVLVGLTSRGFDDHPLPWYGQMPGVYLHALGAETLRSGMPRDFGWFPAFILGIVAAAAALRSTHLRTASTICASSAALLLVLPLAYEPSQLKADIVPALFLLALVSASIAWVRLRRSFREQGTINQASGLLNLDALRQSRTGCNQVLIAARVHNYAQIASALNPEEEAALVEQIANRLTLGRPDQTLYQGDEGIFAWFSAAPGIAAVGEHLDALHGFFRNSLVLGDKQVDLSINFGVDAGSDRLPANRLGSALVACDEAAREGSRWKTHDPETPDEASWKLSLLGQLDRAIDSGDFWVAYQPVLDLASGNLTGAEALARWTHPTKGPIGPIDFILAAEQSDRIEKLTRFVLEKAIAAAAAINAAGIAFNISVNWSTRLVGNPQFVTLVADLLARHGLPAQRLTLEVTETAALGNAGDRLETLEQLRQLGVMISIDDYGTGLSTLEYLKKIPATEIKIDQGFVAAVTRSHADRLMVKSTIELVHSLGQKVVAEGVEDYATLDALQAMGCDFAQGFLISKPLAFDALVDLLGRTSIKKVAGVG